jgi:hypothetical protein
MREANTTTIRRTTGMTMQIKLLAAAAILLSVSAPSFAADMGIRHHHHRHAHRADDIYLHNFGPADFYPGTTVPPDRVVYPVTGRPYGIYDGFDRFCGQSSANYRGQDGQRHPCN